MSEIQPSLNILLSDAIYPPDHHEHVSIISYSASEATVATRGLAKHLDILYTGVNKKSGKDPALMAVYNFLNDGVDKYRLQAHRSIVGLYPRSNAPEIYCQVIACTRLAAESTANQSWRRGKAKDKRLNVLFDEIIVKEPSEVNELRQWAFQNNVNRKNFWRRELEHNRDHPVILDLAEAIDRV